MAEPKWTKGMTVRIKIPLTVSRLPAGTIGTLMEEKPCSIAPCWEIGYDLNGNDASIVLTDDLFEAASNEEAVRLADDLLVMRSSDTGSDFRLVRPGSKEEITFSMSLEEAKYLGHALSAAGMVKGVPYEARVEITSRATRPK